MPMLSTRCIACGHDWTTILKIEDWPQPCPECESDQTVILPSYPSKPSHRGKDMYKVGNIDKPIKSFGNDRRKGGKDTS